MPSDYFDPPEAKARIASLEDLVATLRAERDAAALAAKNWQAAYDKMAVERDEVRAALAAKGLQP